MATDDGIAGALTVHVVYAQPDSVWEVQLRLPTPSRVQDAIDASRFVSVFPNYPLKEIALGVYGQVCTTQRLLANGDRIEIYRPLSFDPMESRRRRAEHREAFMTKPKNRPKRRTAKLAAEQLRTSPLAGEKSDLK